MAHITSIGIGSGLDVNGLLDQLVAAEKQPTELRLNNLEASYTAELTALGSFKSGLSTFQGSLSSLKLQSTFNSKTSTVINEKLFTVSTTSSIAKPGTYNLEVSSLAQSQSLASVAVTNLTDVIGTGTLTFRFGATAYTSGTPDTYDGFTVNDKLPTQTVVIDSASNTLEGVRDAINAAGIGVSASIVNDGNGFRLLLGPDQQGAKNSLEISVAEDGATPTNTDNSGLSQLSFNATAANLIQTQAAQDASIKVNGLQVSRESNSISDAISGVTLNLLSTDVGNPTQLIVSEDTTNVEAKINDFVAAYNDMFATISGLSGIDPTTGEPGVLLGDSTSQTIVRQMRAEMAKSINTGGSFNGLSSVGISTQRDGSLKIDNSVLSAALKSDADSVAKLFYASGTPSETSVQFISSSAATQPGNYAVNISSLATQGKLTAESISGDVVIDANNNSFSLLIDGVNSSIINIAQATYTDMSVLSLVIENSLNASSALVAAGAGVGVVFNAGRFEVTSNSFGSVSDVNIISQNTALGFTLAATRAKGSDIEGSIGTSPAIGDGKVLTGTGTAQGLKLNISSAQTGGLGSVSFSSGLAGNLDSLITQYLSKEGQLTAKVDRITNDISDIGVDRIELNRRVATIETRLRRQFTALDLLVSQLNSTSDFLQQQLDSIASITRGKK